MKKGLGLVWMLTGPIVFTGLCYLAFQNINASVKGDISSPVPWVIILCIFAPISIGFSIFGWYCWQNEYDH